MSALSRIQKKFIDLIEEKRVGEVPIQVHVRDLTPEEAIGNPEHRDYPLVKGRERLLEANVLGSRGQAFTDAPDRFSGSLKDAALLQLDGNRNRAVFVAALNALMHHLGMIERPVHCKDATPPLCARALVDYVRERFGNPRIAMVGLQPRMVQFLSPAFPLRVTDLDADNIGQTKFGVPIQGPDRTRENIDWCDLVLATGSTVVNDTCEELMVGKPAVFYGVTVAGPAVLLGLERYCPYAS